MVMYVLEETEEAMQEHLSQITLRTSPVAVAPGVVLTVPGRAEYGDTWASAAKGVRFAADVLEAHAQKDCARALLMAVMPVG